MRARAVGTLLVTILASAIPCSAADTDWTAALKTYAGNPYQNRGALVRLGHRAGTGVPPLFVLALADAELRGKRLPQARARFTEAINSGLAEPFAGWAHLGLAWATLADGDVAAARAEARRIAEGETHAAPMGEFLSALLDAADGVPDTAPRFQALVESPAATEELKEAARLAVGYAHYWANDYPAALADFDRLVTLPDILDVRDDAQYAAAWVRNHVGDRAGARRALNALTAGSQSQRAASRALVNLEPQALLRAGLERYRRGPLQAPDHQIVQLLNGDGRALAATALRWMAAEGAHGEPFAPPPPTASWSAGGVRGIRTARADELAADASGAPVRTVAARATAKPQPLAPTKPTSTSRSAWGIPVTMALLAMVVFVLLRRRPAPPLRRPLR